MTLNNIHLSEVYVNIGQAAKLLDVNRATIRRWIKQGKLRGENMGLVTLIRKGELFAIAQERGIYMRWT